jgi:hypothetical protein
MEAIIPSDMLIILTKLYVVIIQKNTIKYGIFLIFCGFLQIIYSNLARVFEEAKVTSKCLPTNLHSSYHTTVNSVDSVSYKC